MSIKEKIFGQDENVLVHYGHFRIITKGNDTGHYLQVNPPNGGWVTLGLSAIASPMEDHIKYYLKDIIGLLEKNSAGYQWGASSDVIKCPECNEARLGNLTLLDVDQYDYCRLKCETCITLYEKNADEIPKSIIDVYSKIKKQHINYQTFIDRVSEIRKKYQTTVSELESQLAERKPQTLGELYLEESMESEEGVEVPSLGIKLKNNDTSFKTQIKVPAGEHSYVIKVVDKTVHGIDNMGYALFVKESLDELYAKYDFSYINIEILDYLATHIELECIRAEKSTKIYPTVYTWKDGDESVIELIISDKN